MSIAGSWPMAVCCEVEGGSCAGAASAGSDEQPAATRGHANDAREEREANASMIT